LQNLYACAYIYTMQNKQISVPEFAAIKGVTRDTINKHIQKGMIKVLHSEVKSCNKIGRTYVITLK
jgi:biotin operon repressor